jgi:hypothetical protein
MPAIYKLIGFISAIYRYTAKIVNNIIDYHVLFVKVFKPASLICFPRPKSTTPAWLTERFLLTWAIFCHLFTAVFDFPQSAAFQKLSH